MEKTLASIYLDPSHPASFGDLDAVYRTAKGEGKNMISRKQVQDWLSQEDVYTLRILWTFKISVDTTRDLNTSSLALISLANMLGSFL